MYYVCMSMSRIDDKDPTSVMKLPRSLSYLKHSKIFWVAGRLINCVRVGCLVCRAGAGGAIYWLVLMYLGPGTT